MLFGLTFILGILGVLFSNPLFDLLGATPKLLPFVRIYGLFSLAGAPLIAMKLFFEYGARLDGNAKFSFFLSLLGFILNVVLDYILVAYFDLGILGAALGTNISLFLSAFLGGLYFWRKKIGLKLRRPKNPPGFLSRIFSNGAGEMVAEFSIGIVTFLLNRSVLHLAGEDGVAALSVIMYLFYFFLSVFLGICAALQPRVSFFFGKKEPQKIRWLSKYGLWTTGIFAGLIFSLLFFKGSFFLKIFLNPNKEAYFIAQKGLRLFSFGFLFSGFNLLMIAFLAALFQGKIAFLLSFLRSLGFVSLFLWILPPRLSLDGVFFAMPLSEGLTFLLGLGLLSHRNLKKLRQ